MKNYALLFSLLIFSVACFGQPRKSDRELAGLKGQVRTVDYNGMTVETYDRDGSLTKKDTHGGNCFITDEFAVVGESGKTMKRLINDSSSSGFCTFIHQYLPREAGAIVYELSYFSSNVSYIGEKLNEWQLHETATVAKALQWRKYQYFDAQDRLTEEITIGKDMIARTTVYKYEGDEADPLSARMLINNRHQNTYRYKYDERDVQGNWIKRTTVKIEPENYGGLEAIKRTITYY